MKELPKKRRKAIRQNPKSMVLFSMPKTGKTTITSALDNCLLIDLEAGSHFVDALVYDVLDSAREQKKEPIVILKRLINIIRKENEENGSPIYKYIAVDTVSALEDIVLPLAAKMYRDTPMGRNWVGSDVSTLPNGGGYKYWRDALSSVLNELKELCETLIILGHVKDKMIEKEGKEMQERGLDLTGKSASILCAQVDALGYVYREENETIINFKSSSSLISGARSPHLKDKEIVVATSDDQGNLKIDWSEIFINE